MTPEQYYSSRIAEVGVEGFGDELAVIVRALTTKQLLSLNPTFEQMRSLTFIRDLHCGHSMYPNGGYPALVAIEVLKLHTKAAKK